MTEHQAEATSDVLYCEVHTDRETTLRCNRCGRAMCAQCAVRTPVGYRCRECVREQQGTFYNAARTDYVIAAVLSLIVGGIGAVLVSAIGFFYLAFFLSPAAGAMIGNLVHRAVGKRRGRYTWAVAAGGIVLGAILVRLLPALFMLITLAAMPTEPSVATGPVSLTPFLFSFADIGWWIYVVMAPGAAISVLRVGRGRIRLGR